MSVVLCCSGWLRLGLCLPRKEFGAGIRTSWKKKKTNRLQPCCGLCLGREPGQGVPCGLCGLALSWHWEYWASNGAVVSPLPR